MKLYSGNDSYKLYNGSMLDMLEVIEPNSIDSIVTDPPYELNFMGKGWDNSGIAFQKETWEKCFKVLKAGGYLLAFGGSRTFHRIACAIEDAGFEIRDTIMWLYGDSMPKSLNIGLAIDKRNGVESKVIGTMDAPSFKDTGEKQKEFGNNGRLTFGQIQNAERLQYEIKEAQNEWAGYGSTLKPAFEPVIVARKPVEKTIIDNVLKYGVGGLNIDECRIPCENDEEGLNDKGRFPSNVILSYNETDFEQVCGGMPVNKSSGSEPNLEPSNADTRVFSFANNHKSGKHYEDEGSAARYFYCAKATRKDRDEGLDGFETKLKYVDTGTRKPDGKSVFESSTTEVKNFHPCIKPITLMQYLVRLVTPNGGTVLDCFNGSGSTGKAVMYENAEHNKNYKYIGIELTDEYLPIAKARIEFAYNLRTDVELEYTEEKEQQVAQRLGQIDMFELVKEN